MILNIDIPEFDEVEEVEEIETFPFPFNEFIPASKLTNEEYHAINAISASGVKTAWKDPKLYALKGNLKRLDSPALEMGTALHEAVLEPEKFDILNYELTPANIKKLEIMNHNGRLMFDYILSKTKNEESLFVKDDGFIRKVRVDSYDPKKGVIYDVKTTRYNSPQKFMKDAFELGYHLQAAFYLDTLRMAGFKADYFAFLCIPSESPCEPFAVQITDTFIEDGINTYLEIVENIKNYKESNENVFFKVMDLPYWRLKQIEEGQ